MTYYRRRTLETWEEAVAFAAGALAGVAATYVVRIWLRRSPTDGRDRGPDDRTEGTESEMSVAPRPTEGGAGRPR